MPTTSATCLSNAPMQEERDAASRERARAFTTAVRMMTTNVDAANAALSAELDRLVQQDEHRPSAWLPWSRRRAANDVR